MRFAKRQTNELVRTVTTQCKPAQGIVLSILLLAVVSTLGPFSSAQEKDNKPTGITIASLAGPWQMAIVGNAGCGATSLLFTGTLNSSGEATGTLTASSGCGVNDSSTETFTIKSLNANGSGTANLTCGVGCGWNFSIQVSTNKQVFNLVDVTDPVANYLAGTAIKQ